MSTPHNEAPRGAFAKTVIMSGDPLRAKYIAEKFLENAIQLTQVRGMLAYTGTYRNTPVSVMGHGMGIPSIGIYSYELFTEYDVENIIRIGSAGSYTFDLDLYDVLLVTEAISESTYAKVMSGYEKDVVYPSAGLVEELRKSAERQNIPIVECGVHSSDVFYRKEEKSHPFYWERLRDERGCLAVEMESFALFHNAAELGKHAACLLTVSDSFVKNEKTSPEERQKCFTNMMKIALEAVR